MSEHPERSGVYRRQRLATQLIGEEEADLPPAEVVPDATTEVKGIVELAEDGETGADLAVQASDGRLEDARPPLPHAHSAADITSGTMAIAQLGASGTPGATTFLRGDNSWATPAGGGGDLSATRLDVDNLRVDGNTISSTNTNGDINATPSGTGVFRVPGGTGKLALGSGGASIDDYNSDGRIGFNAGGSRRADIVDLGGTWAFRFGARMLSDATIDDCNAITVNGCRFLGFRSSAGAPTTAELPNNKDLAIHRNSSSGVVSLAFNDSGTIKTLALA